MSVISSFEWRVVPTGVLVSGAAVVAFHRSEPLDLVVVFAVAAVAAFAGDIALYWLGLRGVRLNLAVEGATSYEDLLALSPKIRDAVGVDKFAPLAKALGKT